MRIQVTQLRSWIVLSALIVWGRPATAQQDLNDPALDLNRVWVFAVGVEKYDDPAFPAVRYCGDDAAGLVRIFKTIGEVPDRRIKAFVGNETTPVKAEDLRAAFEAFAEDVGVRDTLIVFFSGHGHLDAKGNYVLVTTDCKADNAVETGLSITWLKQRLADCRAANKIVLLNACYSGSFAGDTKKRINPQAAVDTLKEASNTVAVSSSSQDRVSFELDEYKAGLFSHWLKIGLRGYANARIDDAIDLDELFSYVTKQVDAKTTTLGLPEQVPVLSAIGLQRFPRVIPLRRPEKPSLTVAEVSNFPLEIDEGTAPNILATIPYARLSSPRRCIGLCKLIIRRLGPASPSSRNAQKLIELIDQTILDGKTRLEPVDRGD